MKGDDSNDGGRKSHVRKGNERIWNRESDSFYE